MILFFFSFEIEKKFWNRIFILSFGKNRENAIWYPIGYLRNVIFNFGDVEIIDF